MYLNGTEKRGVENNFQLINVHSILGFLINGPRKIWRQVLYVLERKG